MLGFLARRLFYSLFVLLSVSLISFVLFSVIGDPVANIIGQETSPEHRAQIRLQLGLDAPYLVQYFSYLQDAASGNFGLSLRTREPVLDILSTRLPATIELVLLSAFIGILIGFPLGCFSAFRPASALGRIGSNVALM